MEDEKIDQKVDEGSRVNFYDDILSYLRDHPEIIYKGVPMIFVIYMSSPIIFFTWSWLPWIWASYEIYNNIPRGTISLISETAKFYFKKK